MDDLRTLGLARRVDRLLAPWQGTGSPGVTVGVVQDGRLAVHRHAGMASIELGVPIDAATTFRIASVSKQFTTAAILLLAEEGRLGVEDDVRTHIPELADFGQRITVAQLMHNSSGLRDMLEIMRMGGIDLSYPVTPEELMAGICRQRTLNFAPGSRYLYSNTNFLLLGRIAERVSGERLRDLLERRIFAPLGMGMTRMVESVREVVPGLCTGYLSDPAGGWVRAQHGFPLHGEGALVSSVIDLALWERSYRDGIAGRLPLERQARFTGGGSNHYARGLTVGAVRNLRVVGHGGLWPGYRTEFLRIPERDAAVIVIANSGLANPYAIGQAVLDMLADAAPQAHAARALPTAAVVAPFAGRFVDRAMPATVDLEVGPGGVLTGTAHGQPFGVVATADGRLAAARSSPDWTMRLSDDAAVLIVEHDAGVEAIYHRVSEAATLPSGLDGSYQSDEMAAVWTIAGSVIRVAGPVGHGVWEVEPIEGEIFRIITPNSLVRGWFDARVERDATGAAARLLVHGGRVKNLILTRRTA